MTCKACLAVISIRPLAVLAALAILLPVGAFSQTPVLPTIDWTNRVRAHGPAPDPYRWCGTAPTGGVTRTHGWLMDKFSSTNLVGEQNLNGTNEAAFLWVWEPHGEKTTETIVPVTLPANTFGFVQYCEFPMATWYTVSTPMKNGDLFVRTNWAGIPIGFYRVRYKLNPDLGRKRWGIF